MRESDAYKKQERWDFKMATVSGALVGFC